MDVSLFTSEEHERDTANHNYIFILLNPYIESFSFQQRGIMLSD